MNTAVQLTIAGVTPPPPPTATKELAQSAIAAYIKRYGLWDGTDPEESAAEIAKHWHNGIDGYALAKDLESYEGWAICAQDIEELDNLDSEVSSAVRAARKQWATEWNIQPPYPDGALISWRSRTGTITGIREYEGATYCVQMTGDTDLTRKYLVNFEDAVLVVEVATA